MPSSRKLQGAFVATKRPFSSSLFEEAREISNLMSSLSLYRRSEGVDLSRVGDRVILYERQTRRAIVLNPTGARLWEALAKPQNSEQLAQQLLQSYPTLPQEQAHQDVETYLGELLDQKLIRAENN